MSGNREAHEGPRREGEIKTKKVLDNRRTKSEYWFAVRWAMCSVPSKSTSSACDWRPAQQTALFPADCPDRFMEHDPKARTGPDLAPIVTGPGGSISGCPTPDCPPASSAEYGAPRHQESRTRDAAACCGAERTARLDSGGSAPLVGIARLAADSPVAETRRGWRPLPLRRSTW